MDTVKIATFFVTERAPAARFLEAFYSKKLCKEVGGVQKGKVKFEYVRIRLFRCLKRSLRQYLRKNSFGLGGVASCSNVLSERLIAEIKDLCKQNVDLFLQFADTKQGPRIDSTHAKEESTRFKTYNNKYMAEIFNHPQLRLLYLLYLELIFQEKDLTKQCSNWNMHCCEGPHSPECSEKWSRFYRMLKQEAEIHVNAKIVFTPVEPRQEMVLCS